MAVAAPTPTEVKGISQPTRLWVASAMGSIYTLAALLIVFSVLPTVWRASVAPATEPVIGHFRDGLLEIVVQVALAVILWFFGRSLAGSSPIHGLRGGIVLGVSTFITIGYFTRAVAMIISRMLNLKNDSALILFFVVLAGFIFLGYRFFAGPRFERISLALEDGGWLSFKQFKRTQGLRVRRLTILGILIILLAGVRTMEQYHHLRGDLELSTPFLPKPLDKILLFPDLEYAGALMLSGLAIWFAYRFVNFPPFADFLIATEAEMNKVSWSTRKQLIRDTIVVLIVVVLMTIFLFVVDYFWGWLLSREMVGVLPSKAETDLIKPKPPEKLEY